MVDFSCPVIAALMRFCQDTEAIPADHQVFDRPELNKEVSVMVGEPILDRGDITVHLGAELKNEVSFGEDSIPGFGVEYKIPPGPLGLPERSEDHTYFLAQGMTRSEWLAEGQPWGRGGLCVSNSDPSDIHGFVQIGDCDWELDTVPELEPIAVLDWNAPATYRQTLIYGGRVGDGLRLRYREFLGDFSRPPLELEFEHPLADGNFIDLKGARIEVIEARLDQLRYRVISRFEE